MRYSQLGRSWVTTVIFTGTVGLSLGACSKEESRNDDTVAGGSGSDSANGKGASHATDSSSGSAGESSVPTSTGNNLGGTSGNSSATAATGNVPACEGIFTTEDAVGDQTEGACDGQSLESEAIPTDMIILMDKSISNSYAIGTSDGTPAATGTLSRWEVLTAGMEALATSKDAADIGASITFFSVNGAEDEQCDPSSYQKPIVPLGPLSETGPDIVAKMRATTPGGLTPTEPALQGALTYAMQEKAANPEREKVVVLMSDGYPTQCTNKLPSDITAVIAEAAAAPIPIRTFIVGIGDPNKLSTGSFNLKNYARAGKTGTPILVNETEDANATSQQIVNALLNISNKPLACEYEITPPSEGQAIDAERMTVTFQPASGKLQELPRVSGPSACSGSKNGGFYFDNPTNPTKVTVCPCNCAAFGAGTVSLVYGCRPILVIE